uniref:Small ribosomal subunit protein uS8c n=1 Tax=Boodleopsis sp. FL1161 TaxID=2364084 RepID=A0A386AZC3_9CHLO|nr:ribosomal protein S8 [Boodleopsis sp. FL1161]
MINDSISDLFTRIRNANLVQHPKVFVLYTKTNESIAKILARHGFIVNYKIVNRFIQLNLKYKNNKPIIKKIQRLSRPSCQLYVKKKNILKISEKIGVLLLSTSKGILSDREAIQLNVGGEIIGFVS